MGAPPSPLSSLRVCALFSAGNFHGHSHPAPKYELSSRPQRTRISCHTALGDAACAPFRKERRMKFAEATKFNRKSGEAKWRDLRFSILATDPDGSTTLSFVISSGR